MTTADNTEVVVVVTQVLKTYLLDPRSNSGGVMFKPVKEDRENHMNTVISWILDIIDLHIV